ncbi:MAG: biotin--[acetyl-CoA-carboxylase] ligase [Firmicutes bacterium]|nr:biotin--[acetyl-CoA-carboxylase] ligase [Bacillota bacterium]
MPGADQLPTRWLGRPLWHLASVDSTNRWLKAAMDEGRAGHGAVVAADAQTAGRGRRGRTWASPPLGNIYASVLLFPPPERLSGVLSLLAGVAVVEAVREAVGLDVRLKWPNDVVAGGRKCAGVLVEAGTSPHPWAIVGVGINVNGEPPEAYASATSLRRVCQRTLDADALFFALLGQLERLYDAWLENGDAEIVARWSQRNVTLGALVEVHQPGQRPWIGRAQSVDEDGSLWVERAGVPVKVMAGDVSVRVPGGGYAPESLS